MTRFARLLRDDSGATAIEYGLLVALLSIGAIFALTTSGQEIGSVFNTVGDSIDNAAE